MPRFVLIILSFLLFFELGAQTHHKSIIALYESTMDSRDLMVKGETHSCLEKVDSTLSAYLHFPQAELYIPYLLSYKALCLTRLAHYDEAEILYLIIDWYASNSGNQTLRIANLTNLSTLETDRLDFQESIDLIDELNLSENDDSYYICLNNLAMNLMMLNGYKQADSVFQLLNQAIQIKNMGSEFDLPLFNRNYGRLLGKEGHYLAAQELLSKALEGYKSKFGLNHYKTADTYKYLAELQAEQRAFTDAFESYQKGFSSFEHILKSKSPGRMESSKMPYETIYLSFVRSYCGFINSLALDSVRIEFAIDDYEILALVDSTLLRIDKLINELPASESIFILSGKVRKLFDEGILIALRLYKQNHDVAYLERAFEWSLRSKSYSLTEVARREKQQMIDTVQRELRNRQRELNSRIGMLKNKGHENWSSEDVEALLEDLSASQIIADSLSLIRTTNQEVEIQSENYLALLKQKLRGKDQSLISYHLIDHSLHIFILANGHTELIVKELPEELFAWVEDLKQILYQTPTRYYEAAEVRNYEHLANQVYLSVVDPIPLKYLKKNLIVQLDGVLTAIPLSALVKKISSQSRQDDLRFRDLDYLFLNHRIQYWMGELKEVSSAKRKRNDEILSLSCYGNSKEMNLFGEIHNARFSRIETLNSGVDYSRKSLHLASHFHYYDKNPLESGLICSGEENPFLTMQDLLYTQLNDSRVYLNGCETGGGQYYSGEGLLSLGLVFGIAGSDVVISNLWETEDQTAAKIASAFYRQGIPVAYGRKLNSIKKNYLKKGANDMDHPHFWAGSVCYSKETNDRYSFGLFIGLLIFALTLMGLVVHRRSSR